MDTRDLIIQNSFVLFLQKGIKEVSINEIIKSCGLSKGAFYYHFESKEMVYMKEVFWIPTKKLRVY
jgi:TetR/AcrR family transcriptional repressor of nem operon